MIIIPGPSSRELGMKVADLMKAGMVDVKSKTHPDGEVHVRLLEDVRDDVAIIQTTAPPQDRSLLELFILIDTAKDLGAKSITAVVPYLAYARQSKRFLNGEAISVNTVIKILNSLGIDRFIAINVHEREIIKRLNVQADNLSAISLLAGYFKQKGLGKAYVFAPDLGAIDLVREANEVLGGGYGWIEKERDKETGEIRYGSMEIDVEGRKVIVFDDIISTGGTMTEAARILNQRGASCVYAACVHPLLVGNALKKVMFSKVRGVVGTDCVPSVVSVVSVAPLIAEALRR